MISLRELGTVVSAILATALTPLPSCPEEPEKRPLSTGYVEEAETTLVLFDIRVKDRKGEPVRGLKKGDFEISVDGHAWPVEAVDDFCKCTPAADDPSAQQDAHAKGTGRGSMSATGFRAGVSPPREQPREPFQFVLFLDHRQLDSEKRVMAAREARRWVRGVMGEGDQAMVMASGLYLKELSPMTGDKTQLLPAIDASAEDPDLDDVFPRSRWIRQLDCSICQGQPCAFPPPLHCCVSECDVNAIQELQHSGRAMRVLGLLMGRLKEIDGRKQLIYFNASGTLFPHRLYGGAGEFIVGTQIRDAEELGAAATAARTAIFAPHWAWSDLNANLGDFSGGGRLSELEMEVERGCSCVYRIALKPRGKRGKVNQVRVYVPRARQTVIFRSVTPTRRDRWHSEVQLALVSPASATSIPLGVSLVPLAFDGRRWTLAVELAFEMDELLRLPDADGVRAEWGAGVFLTQNRSRRDWALEKLAAAETKDDLATHARVMHRNVLEVRPGEYEAAAYVGDLGAETVGGGNARLRLPKKKEPAIVGPTLRRSPERILLLDLPETGEEQEIEGNQVQAMATPIMPGSLRAGDSLFALSWICPGEGELGVEAVWRYLSLDGDPLFRVEGPPPFRAEGELCYRVEDVLELPDDYDPKASYTYHLRWSTAQLESSAALPVGSLVPVIESSIMETRAVDSRPPKEGVR